MLKIPVDFPHLILYSISSMKYKLFVVGLGEVYDADDNRVDVGATCKMQIASSNEFGDFKTLIEQLDLFGTEWLVTERGETVFGSGSQPTK